MSDTNCGVGMYRDSPEEMEIERLTKQLKQARAQLAEQERATDAAVRLWNDCGDDLLKAEVELARLRADAERWQECRKRGLLSYSGVSGQTVFNAHADTAIDAARREGKESTNNNSNQQIQSKEQESSATSNTKLGGESVGLDHRVTSPIQSKA